MMKKFILSLIWLSTVLVGNEFSARDAYLNKNYKVAKNQYKLLVQEAQTI